MVWVDNSIIDCSEFVSVHGLDLATAPAVQLGDERWDMSHLEAWFAP